MGLFDKKYCDICGEKIGLLGNRKLEDGNLCKTCARKLSPFFSERHHSTVEEIKEQLAYREANKEKVAAFHPTRTFNCREYLILDEDKRQLIVTNYKNWKDENPDVIDFGDVTGCDLDVNESRRELYHKNAEGKNVSYEPKRYEYSYDFNMTIAVNSPYFSEIPLRINDIIGRSWRPWRSGTCCWASAPTSARPPNRPPPPRRRWSAPTAAPPPPPTKRAAASTAARRWRDSCPQGNSCAPGAIHDPRSIHGDASFGVANSFNDLMPAHPDLGCRP